MKKLLLLIFTFSLVACSGGDDDNNGSNNSSQSDVLSVSGTDYELDSGNLTNYGPDSSTNAVNIDLDLMGGGIFSACNDVWTGQGQDIYFEMWTSEEEFLDSGTYQINGEYSLFSISYADYALGINFDEDDSEWDWVTIESGSVNVERSGDNYTISWDTIDENGNVVAGSYSGTLSYCDVTGD